MHQGPSWHPIDSYRFCISSPMSLELVTRTNMSWPQLVVSRLLDLENSGWQMPKWSIAVSESDLEPSLLLPNKVSLRSKRFGVAGVGHDRFTVRQTKITCYNTRLWITLNNMLMYAYVILNGESLPRSISWVWELLVPKPRNSQSKTKHLPSTAAQRHKSVEEEAWTSF